MKRLAIPRIIVLAASIPAFAKDPSPADLAYLSEDTPPSNYLENGEFKGADESLVRELQKALDGIGAERLRILKKYGISG